MGHNIHVLSLVNFDFKLLFKKKIPNFVCRIVISQITMLLVALLAPLENPQQVKVHQVGFIVLTYSGNFIKYWKENSPKIHLNQKNKIRGILKHS
jgi:hypothetical protein